MSFAQVRHTLFTVHMWVGLILGILLAALGLSGSLLVYDETISDWIAPPPRAETAGQALPLSMIADIARRTAEEQGAGRGAMQMRWWWCGSMASRPWARSPRRMAKGAALRAATAAVPKALLRAAGACRCISIRFPAKCWAAADLCSRVFSPSRTNCTAIS
jgi:uncharacterized iron-regulated membrane protein